MPDFLFNANQLNFTSESLNSYIEENGFSTKLIVSNLGSSFVYFVVYASVCLSWLLFFWLARYVKKAKFLSDFL